ncbi:MAG TPA: MBL fold metallo-hydrolase [Pseudohongiella sp.]|nr:MBL fold metallo-hydrolase [Pseudohongiella sp.]|tara:strand:- start:73072 stop:74091 length:1020 start_codon:yes stop_codon:yes gene_type:complete
MSQSSVWHDCGFNVACIDTGLFRDGLAACYLIEHDGEAALVDTGTRNSLPRIMQTLADHNISPEQVRWIMPTHVHLDHAGGAGALMDEMPEATLVVHERGARHMIRPEKLQAGSMAVYGEEAYDAAFGQLVPVPEQRVCIAADGDSFDLGSRRLQTLNTAGHARHHYVVWDEHSNGLFTGDTFGVSYPELNTGRGSRFIFPPSTPVQFDPAAWHESLIRLMKLPVERVFLTHFGMHEDPGELAASLHEQIDVYANLARQLGAEFSRKLDEVDSDAKALADAMQRRLQSRLMQHSLDELAARQCTVPPSVIRQKLAGDMQLNAQGLLHWLAQSAPPGASA